LPSWEKIVEVLKLKKVSPEESWEKLGCKCKNKFGCARCITRIIKLDFECFLKFENDLMIVSFAEFFCQKCLRNFDIHSPRYILIHFGGKNHGRRGDEKIKAYQKENN